MKNTDKVIKLFALSESTNFNEATAARDKAFEIMKKYGISENDIPDFDRYVSAAQRENLNYRNNTARGAKRRNHSQYDGLEDFLLGWSENFSVGDPWPLNGQKNTYVEMEMDESCCWKKSHWWYRDLCELIAVAYGLEVSFCFLGTFEEVPVFSGDAWVVDHAAFHAVMAVSDARQSFETWIEGEKRAPFSPDTKTVEHYFVAGYIKGSVDPIRRLLLRYGLWRGYGNKCYQSRIFAENLPLLEKTCGNAFGDGYVVGKYLTYPYTDGEYADIEKIIS